MARYQWKGYEGTCQGRDQHHHVNCPRCCRSQCILFRAVKQEILGMCREFAKAYSHIIDDIAICNSWGNVVGLGDSSLAASPPRSLSRSSSPAGRRWIVCHCGRFCGRGVKVRARIF